MVRCRHCGLVYVNPRIVRAELWERYNQDYFENTYIPAMGDFDPAANFARFEPILQKLHSFQRSRGNLLDIGCATGLFLEAARRDGWGVIGTEISQYAAQYARDRFGLEVLVAMMEEQSVLPSDHFDVVTMWETIEHLENPFETLCSANEVMKFGRGHKVSDIRA